MFVVSYRRMFLFLYLKVYCEVFFKVSKIVIHLLDSMPVYSTLVGMG